MKKITLLLSFCLIISSVVTGFASSSVDAGDSTSLYTVGETTVLTEADVNNGYEDYAAEAATVTLSQNSRTNVKSTNVIGIVLDNKTNEPISNATISYGNNMYVKTDSEGRFNIVNLPDGIYSWIINADTYKAAEYLNYDLDVAGGTNIFIFYIDKDESIVKDSLAEMQAINNEIMEPVYLDNAIQSIAETNSMSVAPNISSTVRVEVNKVVKTLGRKEYLYGVLATEAYDADFYTEYGLTDEQIRQYYTTQATCANTLSVYFQKVETSKHPNCDVCDKEHCQAYEAITFTDAILKGVNGIYNTYSNGTESCLVIMYAPTGGYNYMCPYYFSYCEGKGTDTLSDLPYIKAKDCTDLTKGAASSHHYGMCQMGAALKAKNGYDRIDIIKYYYTGCTTALCKVV